MFVLSALLLAEEIPFPPAEGFPPFTSPALLTIAIISGTILGSIIGYLLYRLKVWVTFLASGFVAFVAAEQIGSSSWYYLNIEIGYYEGVHSFYWLISASITLLMIGLLRVRKSRIERAEQTAITAECGS